MLAKPSLTLKRRINASPEKIYAAWTDAKKVVHWWGPSDTEQVLEAEMDVRIGGRFRIVFRTVDGEEHGVSGTYREVVPGQRLTFTWAWRSTPERESLVTVTLTSNNGGTVLTLLHEQFFDEGSRDRHRGGWVGTLDRLEAYLA